MGDLIKSKGALKKKVKGPQKTIRGPFASLGPSKRKGIPQKTEGPEEAFKI